MFLIPTAFAQAAPNITDLSRLNLGDVVYLFVALAILGAGALSIIFIFFGGFSFILSGGDEGKVKSAIHTIRYAIIGLIIALLSLVIVPFIGRLVGVNFNFFDFATLSGRVNSLFNEFKQGTDQPGLTTPFSSVNPILSAPDYVTPVTNPVTQPATNFGGGTQQSVPMNELIQ